MPYSPRPADPDDLDALATICFNAFGEINRRHGFPPDFPTVEIAQGFFGLLLNHPRSHGVVAEVRGRPAGSAFIWDGNDGIAGIGPVTVDPNTQTCGIGRAMMQELLARATQWRCAGVRLVQAAFNTASMSLYTKLGFVVREPLLCVQGNPTGKGMAGVEVRAATADDSDACAQICRDVHGHHRRDDLAMGIERGTARVAVRDGRITGYTDDVGFFGHGVARDNHDLKALIAASDQINGPGLLIPARNAELLGWCLAGGLRIAYPMTLMTIGQYREPTGAWWPSILF